MNESSKRGQFLRHLKKHNQATKNMTTAHRGLYDERFCDQRLWKKWNNVRLQLERAYSKNN